MIAFFQSVTAWLAANPAVAAGVVFLLAASESLVVIGAFIPGTAVLLALSAAVGLGQLPFWPVLIGAIAGAIAGDGLSYWLGQRYRDDIIRLWPLSRYPGALDAGRAFFARHGGKSVLIARFTPGVRAIVPVMAGATGMPNRRFYVANITSALIWAPAHIVPGAIAGVGFGVLGHISLRLAVALALLALGGFLFFYCIRIGLRFVLPLLDRLRLRLAAGVRQIPERSPRTIFLHILDPTEQARLILIPGVLLGSVLLSFLWLAENVVNRGQLAASDTSISRFMQGLRTAWGDSIMVAVTSLGDSTVIVGTLLFATGWLAWRRAWHMLAGLGVAVALSSAFASAMKLAFSVPRPIAIYDGAQQFSFPSGHATSVATLFGIFTWFALRGLVPPWRTLAVVIFGTIVLLVAVSRIYLAAHWPSDVLGGLLFDAGIAALYGLVFRRTDLGALRPGGLLLTAMLGFATVGGWHMMRSYPPGMTLYAPVSAQMRSLPRIEWLATGWQSLPARRIDLGGETEEPFVLQWGDTPEALQAALTAAGWSKPAPFSLTAFVTPGPAVSLPVLPRLHDGAPPVLTMIQAEQNGAWRRVLRAWNSAVTLAGQGRDTPLLVVSVETEDVMKPMGLFTIALSTDAQSPVPRSLLANLTPKARPDGSSIELGPRATNP